MNGFSFCHQFKLVEPLVGDPDELLHGAELAGRVHVAAVVGPRDLRHVDVATGVDGDAVGE